MAKDSFVIYKSFYAPIKTLSDKQLGRLFRALFDYQIEGSTEVDADIHMAFAFFKNQMDIDESKYQKVVERNRQNGSKGGRKPKEENSKKPVGFIEPKKADNDNVNDNDNDNDNVNDNVNDNKEEVSMSNEFDLSKKNSNSENYFNPKNENKERKKVAQKKESSGKTIEQRELGFKKQVWSKAKNTEYGKDLDELKEFVEYWTEHGDNDKKMRFEKEKSFSINRRLKTWFKKNKFYNPNGKFKNRETSQLDTSETKPTKRDYTGGF